MSEEPATSGHTLHGGRPMWEVRPGPVTGGAETTDGASVDHQPGSEPAHPGPQLGDTQQIPVVRPDAAEPARGASAQHAAPAGDGTAGLPTTLPGLDGTHPSHSAPAPAAPSAQSGHGGRDHVQQAPPAHAHPAQDQAPGQGQWTRQEHGRWAAQPGPAVGAPGPQWDGQPGWGTQGVPSPEHASSQGWAQQGSGPQAADAWGQQQPPFAAAVPVPSGSHVDSAPPPPPAEKLPTAQDFLQGRHQAIDIGPATWGWPGRVRRWSGGLIKPRMSAKEREHREARAAVQRSFSGPRTIVFANPKGGAAKTTSVLAAGYTFGTVRGGGVVAWDNNETRGTLGIRGERANHQNTTRELLDDLERFSDVYESRIGDLGAFVRSQGDAHFDVLASDERADVTGQIKATDFDAVHRLLERFYHLILVDTGNNLRAENWLAAASAADLIVVTCTVREDTGYSGLWMLDALADAGHTDLQARTITVLADPSPSVDTQLADDLVDVYSKRTRAVFRIPYDPALVAGSVVQYSQLSEATRAAWLRACAEMARAL